MKASLLFCVSLFGLASCSYVPEKVQVSYQPMMKTQLAPAMKGTTVDVAVVDNRRDGKQVSHKKGGYGEELASIRLKGDLAEDIASAIKTELSSLGCDIADGDAKIEIDIQKFYNEFKPGFMGGRAVAELILGVNVKKKDGRITYTKNIMGFGENKDVWLHSGKNAKSSLDEAFNDAVHKLLSDQAFLQALK